MIHGIDAYNVPSNLKQLHIFLMNMVGMEASVTVMISTIKNTMGRRLTTTMVTILIASTSNYVIPSVLCVFYYHPSCLLLSLSLSLLLFMFFFVLYLRAIGWRFFSLPRNTNAYGTM